MKFIDDVIEELYPSIGRSRWFNSTIGCYNYRNTYEYMMIRVMNKTQGNKRDYKFYVVVVSKDRKFYAVITEVVKIDILKKYKIDKVMCEGILRQVDTRVGGLRKIIKPPVVEFEPKQERKCIKNHGDFKKEVELYLGYIDSDLVPVDGTLIDKRLERKTKRIRRKGSDYRECTFEYACYYNVDDVIHRCVKWWFLEKNFDGNRILKNNIYWYLDTEFGVCRKIRGWFDWKVWSDIGDDKDPYYKWRFIDQNS